MKAVVVDASSVVEFLLRTPRGGRLMGLMEGGWALEAPELLDVEVASALRGLVLRGTVEPERAAMALADLESMPLERHPHTPLLPRIWALRNRLSAYAATYVSLAAGLDLPLLTEDVRLEGVVRELGIVRVVE